MVSIRNNIFLGPARSGWSSPWRTALRMGSAVSYRQYAAASFAESHGETTSSSPTTRITPNATIEFRIPLPAFGSTH